MAKSGCLFGPLGGLFGKKPPPLTIPYPEEPEDPSKTIANTSIADVMNRWMVNYNVPGTFRDYWRTAIDIKVFDNWPPDIFVRFPGLNPLAGDFTFSEGGTRHLYSRAAWLNPGTLAHEQAHNSYALLTDEQKAGFALLHNQYKLSDPLVKLLYSTNAYGLQNDTEGHAEIYRYLGPDKMPERLRQYYPKLIQTG